MLYAVAAAALALAVLFLRRRRASAPDARDAASVVLLQSTPAAVDAAALRTRLSERFLRPFGSRPTDADLVVEFAPGMLGVLVAGTRVNVGVNAGPLEELRTQAPRMPELRRREALENHRGWVLVGLADPRAAASEDAWRTLARVTAEIADAQTLAVMLPSRGAIVPWTDDVRDALRRGDATFGASAAPVPMARVSRDDPRMQAARAEARARWPEFVARFADRKSNESFAVKAKFGGDDDAEFMWVAVDAIDGDTLRGVLDNDPAIVRGLKAGDRVEVARADVDDWVIRAGGELVGGFTIAVLAEAAGMKG